jgi:uncharacterized RDD family membrane protein YckC
MIWNYVKDDAQQGPVTDEDLEQLLRAGTIDQSTLVWREGMTDWKPYREAKGPGAVIAPAQLTPRAAPLGQVTCAECGGFFPPDDVIHHGNIFICAACKPVFLQKLKEGVAPVGALVYAGFWIRAWSLIIDRIIMVCVTYPLGFGLGMLLGKSAAPFAFVAGSFLGMAVEATYYTWMVGRYGATLGKMANQLLIVNPDGSKVSYAKAIGRFFAANYISGCFTLCIGYLMVVWTDEKCALHDLICSTRVIRK